MVVFVFLLASVSPGFAQTQIDAATRQDVEGLMQLSGARERIPLIYSAMAGQFAAGFAARYQRQHPDAPAEFQNAATEAAERFQQRLAAIPSQEWLNAMIPLYQRYFALSDIKASNEFYGTPTGQKRLKNTNAMMIDAMQVAQAVMNRHMPEIERQLEKTAANTFQPALTQPK